MSMSGYMVRSAGERVPTSRQTAIAPDLLIRCAATTQPACISGPKLASGPVKGLKLAKVNVPE